MLKVNKILFVISLLLTITTIPTIIQLDEDRRLHTVQSISISAPTQTLEVGYYTELYTTILPETARISSEQITWTSSNSNVATVSTSGVVTGVSGGTATITATTNNNLYASCSITVSNNATTYTISYALNGGTNSSSNPTSYTKLDTITLSQPTKTGYTFKGWTGNNGNTPQTSITISRGSMGDKTYTANWKIIEYTITYVLNGGTNNESNPISYNAENNDIVLIPATFTNEKVSRWYSDNNFKNRVKTIPAGSYGDITLYARAGYDTSELYYINGSTLVKFYQDLFVEFDLKIDYIPNIITEIASNAFKDCSLLTNITIPDSVTKINSGAFSGCSSLESNILPFIGYTIGTSRPFGYIFGTRFYTGATTQREYDSNTTYYIPSSLRSVTITGGNIYYNAFYSCSSLTSITIPNSVTSIGKRAFSGCSSLTSISLGNNISVIVEGVFYECTSLTSIDIPNSVTSIGYDAFSQCSSLTKVITQSVEGWLKILFSNEFSNPLYYAKHLYIGENEVREVVIQNTITNINEYVFYNCSSLTSIDLPDSVTSIGDWSFYNCRSLTSITIGNGITSIGSSAFEDCSSLTIYCETTSKPSSWYSSWNYSNRPVYLYSETKPTTSGNYWHYVDGKVVVW